MTLSFDQVKAHWERWAAEYGTSLRATTKTHTIKLLEIFALVRHIPAGARMLDVGCGNGYNALSFAETVAGIRVTGVDYSPDMIANAR
jgi:ubiquinone/menaquinone biosynthesis C-methylase UbiE